MYRRLMNASATLSFVCDRCGLTHGIEALNRVGTTSICDNCYKQYLGGPLSPLPYPGPSPGYQPLYKCGDCGSNFTPPTQRGPYAVPTSTGATHICDACWKARCSMGNYGGTSWNSDYKFSEDDLRPKGLIPPPPHAHKWQEYTGFTEKYEYCDCGKKRDGKK